MTSSRRTCSSVTTTREQVTAAADLYSLGAVTYELLSGRAPYKFESLDELPVKQREGPPPPIDGVSEELQDAVRRCLAPDPANRPASAAALAHELAQASPAAKFTSRGLRWQEQPCSGSRPWQRGSLSGSRGETTIRRRPPSPYVSKPFRAARRRQSRQGSSRTG